MVSPISRPLFYVLDDSKRPVPVDDLWQMALWMQENDKHVANDYVDGVRVSTVFLGMDQKFVGLGPPVLFETMVFVEGETSGIQRYCTWEQAESGHRFTLGEVRLFQQRAENGMDNLIESIKQAILK